MLADLLSTPDDPLLTIIRMVLGVIMFAHGAKGAFSLDRMFYQHLGNLGAPQSIALCQAEITDWRLSVPDKGAKRG